MGKALGRLGGWIYNHAKSTITIIIAVIALIIELAMSGGAHFAGTSLNIPKSESQKAMKVVDREFNQPGSDLGSIKVVIHSKNGQDLTSENNQAKIQELLEKIQGQSHVKAVLSPALQNNYSADKKTGYATITFNQKKNDVSLSEVSKVKQALKVTRDANIETELSGNVTLSKSSESSTEVIGIIVAYIVLAITFASLLVAGLPIFSAIIGLLISMMIIMIMTNFLSIPSTSSSLVLMMGMAVGIDYSLFIISRYRQEVAQGKSKIDALQTAMSTAGSSVIFAGMTVMVAMAAMAVLQIDFLTSMGLPAALGVLFAVLTSITFVPAILSLLGEKVTGKKNNNFLDKIGRLRVKGGFGRLVVKHRIKALVLSVFMLVLVAIPDSHMNLGLPNDGEASKQQTERRAYDLEKEAYGDGVNATLVVLAKTTDMNEANITGQHIKDFKNVANVSPAIPGKTGQYYMLAVTPKTDANNQATKKLIRTIRNYSKNNSSTKLSVTGATAINIDVSDTITTAIPLFAALIIVFAFVLLMIAFRSLLIPLIAVLGFGLSLCATLGSVVWIVQDGHLLDLFQLPSKATILAFLPVLVIGIMFGLAMDYEIFLVSRIREEYNKTKDNNHSVVVGLQENGTVVFAAIVIMASVFAGFIFAPKGIMKSIGLSFTFGVLFDALLVRMVIVPASIALFGKVNWYLPKWLDKVLPDLNLE